MIIINLEMFNSDCAKARCRTRQLFLAIPI